MDKLKTAISYKHACKVLGRKESALPNVKGLSKWEGEWITDMFKLMIIATATRKINNWKPDYHTQNTKYWPTFGVEASEKKPQGFGFSDADYGGWHASTSVGSPLSYPSAEHAIDAGKRHKKLFLKTQLLPE